MDSDRTKKANISAIDPAIRHIGPMAQDFAALFGVGNDDRHIHPSDGQGVALAAIQGLITALEQVRDENSRLTARLERLERVPHMVVGGGPYGSQSL